MSKQQSTNEEAMSKKPFIVRQGDVLVMQVSEIPVGTTLVPRDNGRIVLAYGEVTGHAHAIIHERAELKQHAQLGTFLDLPKPAVLQHEEHAPISLPAGTYRVVRQREYHPESIRNVAD